MSAEDKKASIIKKRRTLVETKDERNYICGCGKNYCSYPAIYLHFKKKHNGFAPEGTLY